MVGTTLEQQLEATGFQPIHRQSRGHPVKMEPSDVDDEPVAATQIGTLARPGAEAREGHSLSIANALLELATYS